jgi:hypothetical protein
MNTYPALAMLVAGSLLAGGCATKKYVLNTTAPIQAKVDQVGDQANKNTASIEDARKERESTSGPRPGLAPPRSGQ